jgi:peptidoglycan/LPS O-acetylase OafA/YrhL
MQASAQAPSPELETARERNDAAPRARSGMLTSAQENYLHFARALAANAVVIGHVGAIYGLNVPGHFGAFGVSVFFLLSGFLIFQSAVHRIHDPRPAFLSFMIDRVARIFVPYIPVLALAALVNVLVDVGRWGQPGINTGAAAFFANLFMLQDHPAFAVLAQATHSEANHIRAYNTAEPFWTVPLEFWTYVFFAVAFFIGVKRERAPWWVVCTLLATSAPVVLWNAFAGGGGGLSWTWAIGAFAGFCWWRKPGATGARPWLTIALIAVGALGFAGRAAKAGLNFYETQTILFVAMMLFGVLLALQRLDGKSSIFGVMARRLADYSYSLYLVHNTAIIVVFVLLAKRLGAAAPFWAFVAAHLAAIAIYVLFESRYRAIGAAMKRVVAPLTPSASNDANGPIPADMSPIRQLLATLRRPADRRWA